MTMFSEWQQMPQTKAFVAQLQQSIEEIKEEAIAPSDGLSLEQIAISTIERNAAARVLEQIIGILKEDVNEQT